MLVLFKLKRVELKFEKKTWLIDNEKHMLDNETLKGFYKSNKAGYTATLVAYGWAGAGMEKVTGHLGRSREL